MKKKAQEIEKIRIEAAKGGPSRMTAISSLGGGAMGGGMSVGGGGGGVDAGPSFRPEPAVPSFGAAKEPARGPKKGMQVWQGSGGPPCGVRMPRPCAVPPLRLAVATALVRCQQRIASCVAAGCCIRPCPWPALAC